MSSRDEENETCTALSRRDFARILGTAAAGAGISALPFAPGLTSRARAGTEVPQRAKRLLVVNLTGAARSSALFHASTDVRLNPWGVRAVEGSSIAYGNVLADAITDPLLSPTGAAEVPLPDAAYELSSAWRGARLPRFHEFAGQMALLGTWNDGRGDHQTSQIEETTGERTPTAPGLLTRIHMALAARAGGVMDYPPFYVAPSVYLGQAPAATVGYAPITLAGAESLPSEAQVHPDLERRTARAFRQGSDLLDRPRIDRLLGPNRLLATAHSSARRSAARFGRELAAPWINPLNAAFRDAAQGDVDLGGGVTTPLTNAMLYEVMIRALGPDPLDPARARPLPDAAAMAHPRFDQMIHAALAIRLLQLGSPTVAVELTNFDFHSGERDNGPALYRTTGRLLASLHWLLSRLRDPEDPGASMLDTTLVAVTSEFARDPGPNANGFNDGEGSDHGSSPSSMFMPILLFGSSGLRRGEILGTVETSGANAYDARRSSERFSTQQGLATLIAALGLDPADDEWGFPEAGTPALGLWEGA
jgi:uncharacterized protein (DUF1501 family)